MFSDARFAKLIVWAFPKLNPTFYVVRILKNYKRKYTLKPFAHPARHLNNLYLHVHHSIFHGIGKNEIISTSGPDNILLLFRLVFYDSRQLFLQLDHGEVSWKRIKSFDSD